MRLAILSRFWSSVRGMNSSQFTVRSLTRSSRPKGWPLHFAHGALLDALFEVLALKNGIHIDSRRVHKIGINFPGFHKFFHLCNYEVSSRSHHWIQIARRLAIDEVAPAIALPRFDKGEIGSQRTFQDVHSAAKFAGLLAFGHNRPKACGRVKRGNARATRAQPPRERPLGIQLQFEFTAERELLEVLIPPDIRGDHLLDLAVLQ